MTRLALQGNAYVYCMLAKRSHLKISGCKKSHLKGGRCGPLDFLIQSEVEVGEQFDTVLDRWDSAEGFMRSMVVVAV